MLSEVLGEAAQSSRLLLCEATRKARECHACQHASIKLACYTWAIFRDHTDAEQSLASLFVAGSPEKLPASRIHAAGQDLS